jgi:glycerate kinase
VTRVVVAPDKFKGSLTAAEVAAAVRRGLLSARPGLDVVVVPVADGGEGTLEAATAAGFRRVDVMASGPLGEPVRTAYARRDDVAVVELADVCGLGRLPPGRHAPGTATTRGLGEVIAAALDAGCRRVVVGIGGSASTDGGAGLVQGLGARLEDAWGVEVAPGGEALRTVAEIDLGGLHPALAAAELVVASDVDNPLTGPRGAAAVYGPQKGATEDDVRALDAAMTCWADQVARVTGSDLRDVPGSGAAGGVGFAALALLGADLRPGIDLVLDLARFDDQLRGADLVIVGEGSLDSQSMRGKAPVGVAARARAAGVPVVAVCGRTTLSGDDLAVAGIDATYALRDVEPDPAVCLANAETLLEGVAGRIARERLRESRRTPR